MPIQPLACIELHLVHLLLSRCRAGEAALLLPLWPATLLALPLEQAALVELQLLTLKDVTVSAAALSWPG